MPRTGKTQKTEKKGAQRRGKRKVDQGEGVRVSEIVAPLGRMDKQKKIPCQCNVTLAAIGEKCLACSHGVARDVRLCSMQQCALHKWRESGLKCFQEKGN